MRQRLKRLFSPMYIKDEADYPSMTMMMYYDETCTVYKWLTRSKSPAHRAVPRRWLDRHGLYIRLGSWGVIIIAINVFEFHKWDWE